MATYSQQTEYEILIKLQTEPHEKFWYSCAVQYATNKLKRRWPEAEPYIIRDSFYAVTYAFELIGGRWPEAEPNIIEQQVNVIYYIRNAIKGRWLEAEPFIFSSEPTKLAYIDYLNRCDYKDIDEYE